LADLLLLLLGVLSIVTVVASVAYYREVRKAQREYEKAKGVIEDLVLSFGRELKHDADKLELVASKIDENSARADNSLRKVETLERRMAPLENQVSIISKNKIDVTSNMTNILSGLEGLESKLKDIEATQEMLKVKVGGFEEQIQKVAFLPAEFRTEPVMPIKRDKAMAALTGTEVIVLEFLSSEGPKTAPEIKERVKLSREHTARLMKKLYEEGYLEREVGKIPFRYSIKNEMEKLLKKT
jgi:chromosome segregation ATPase